MKQRAQKSGEDFLQFRIKKKEKRGSELIEKLQKIAEANGLSANDIANLAIAAGINMVEQNLSAIHEPKAA